MRLKLPGLTCVATIFLTPSAFACTIFTHVSNESVWVGANEDVENIDTFADQWIWPRAPKQNKNGYFTLGFKAYPLAPQAGINNKGLFFDYNSVAPISPEPNGKPVAQFMMADKLMAECSTVAEAIAILDTYDLKGLAGGQMFLVDAQGNSAIIEQRAVTYRKHRDFQIGTNFRTSTTPENSITCQRYKTSYSALSEAKIVTEETILNILKATALNEKFVTKYSIATDLKSGRIKLFLNGDPSTFPWTGTISDILSKGNTRINLKEFIHSKNVHE
ncbi:hypothetical protein CCB80_13585 [Armatimonadetes bacterium Uphvl-Ar1]|nr:hypothetical protein CCB80_13585 [Armatimonadetes bacterium Uphvl-Ar1]